MDMLTDGGTSGKITEGEGKGRETAGKAPSPAGVGGSTAAAVDMAAPHGTSSLTRCALLLLLLFLPLLPTVAAVLPWAQGSRSRRAARKWRAGSGGHGASAALRHFGHRGMEPRGWGAVRGLQLKGEVWDCLRRQQRGVTDAGLQVYVRSVKDGSSVRAGIKLPGDRWAGWQEKGIPSYLLLVFVCFQCPGLPPLWHSPKRGTNQSHQSLSSSSDCHPCINQELFKPLVLLSVG